MVQYCRYSDAVNLDDPALLKKPHLEDTPKTSFEPAVLTRQVDLVPDNSSQQVTVGAHINNV
jgi:hypothetical protein